jgi:hypothetical protein
MEIGTKVRARWVEKSNEEWVMKEKVGKIEKDLLFAFYNKDEKMQNLYRIVFEDGMVSNLWSNQLEKHVDEEDLFADLHSLS